MRKTAETRAIEAALNREYRNPPRPGPVAAQFEVYSTRRGIFLRKLAIGATMPEPAGDVGVSESP